MNTITDSRHGDRQRAAATCWISAICCTPMAMRIWGSFLHFEESGDGGTLLRVSADGAFTGDATHDASVAYQTIELANVDLLSLGSDQQIIDTLINQNKLITE